MKIEEVKEQFKKINLTGPVKLSDDEINLAVIRRICMERNPYFIKERKALLSAKKRKAQDFLKMEAEFLRRWGITRDCFPRRYRNYIIAYFKGIPHILNVKVDLRCNSKRKLMEGIKTEVDRWYKTYREERQDLIDDWLWIEYDNTKRKQEGYEDFKKRRLKEDNELLSEKTTQVQDFNLYCQYFRVYDLRQKGFTWEKIIEEMELHWPTTKELDIYKSRVRNYFNAAKRLIENGVPGFEPFPQGGVK
jgi:hypothetical protein